MKITNAVIPVAGLGTRFLPATKAQPKEMLPLVDKPIIQYSVEEAKASGLEMVIFVTGKGKNAIENHFDTSYELEDALGKKGKAELLKKIQDISNLIEIAYVRQQQPPLGLGHAVLMAKNLIADPFFAVFLPDDVIDGGAPCTKQLIEAHQKTGGAVIAVEKTDAKGQERYGIVKVEPTDDPKIHKIVDIVEKPGAEHAPSDLAVVGRYILPRDIFAEIEKVQPGAGGEIQLTDAIRAMLQKKDFYAYEFEGKKLDAGEVGGYLKANLELGLKRDDLREDLVKFIKEKAKELE